MRCYHCSHEIKDSAFAYKGRQECKECHSIYQIHFPSVVGFIPIVIAFIPALYMVTILRYAFIVGLAIFVIFYWEFFHPPEYSRPGEPQRYLPFLPVRSVR